MACRGWRAPILHSRPIGTASRRKLSKLEVKFLVLCSVSVDCPRSIVCSDRFVFLLYTETAARFLTEKDDAQKQVAALRKELESAKKESQEAAEKQRQLYEEKLAQITAREADLGKRLQAASASLSGKCDASLLI